jgi:hypothetical protein
VSWVRVRLSYGNTNLLARLNRKIGWHTDVVGIFPKTAR